MITRLLSWLFPPRTSKIHDWTPAKEPWFDEQGCARNVTERWYADGIDKHFQEEDKHDSARTD